MTTNITDLFTDEASNGILDLWFADAGPYPTHEQAMRWFKADEGFDEEIRTKFGPLLTQITSTPPSTILSLATTPHRALSLVLLLDQFPRNLFRGDLSAHVYTTTDPLAIAVANHSIAHNLDLGPNDEWRALLSRRMWFWLPFTHSEDPALHVRAQKEFAKPVLELIGDGEGKEMAAMLVKSGAEHLEVVEKFGRYPYRNKVLGRESTEEEKKWLENPVDWAR
ncbi:uncharacterized protein LAJ45_01503 [Morchella importuna]|uniref:DUF924-domain-containing protein n=1 Tax=Morchella conica CCBAS932 TaxID=1392247 RepID=A0A3N4KCL5_9PEZI|nr:uncharacterized protein LAJ45_01503 [Morchella importuna]KAH8154970.1 hypothetical protein LAJ45_01503 [Morchella importuna]RPB08246.1 DUF924-domain-containing protein [Morchella conica CCBAS932]